MKEASHPERGGSISTDVSAPGNFPATPAKMSSAFPAENEQFPILFIRAFLRAHSAAFSLTSMPSTSSNFEAAESANIPAPQ